MKLKSRYFFIIFLFAALSVSACQSKKETISQEKAFQLMERAIAHFHLTKLPSDCLLYEEEDDPGYLTLKVRANQNERCGGDPAISPRLFTIRTNMKTGEITSDAQSQTGEMLPLR